MAGAAQEEDVGKFSVMLHILYASIGKRILSSGVTQNEPLLFM